ncbi:hypothetical protein [Flagellimonas marinaquae]|uniref:hypothetical protein n=1 Tax=Flagellimonas marinaquae TaxID=254955 RepID=UPI000F8E39EA|nr:hypothetical protein [Allomuricauda aquimarina]
MKKVFAISIVVITYNFCLSQTSNNQLNQQLNEMKNSFILNDIDSYVNYIDSFTIESMGGKNNAIKIFREEFDKKRDEGFSFLEIDYKDPSKFLKRNNELQCSITQEMLLESPEGKMLVEYSIIAISIDEGNNWKFIDTYGKKKEIVLDVFSNISHELPIIPISKTPVD